VSKPKDPEESHKSRCFMRAEAIRRNPQYRQEWETAFKSYRLSLQKEIEELFGSFSDSDYEMFSFEDSDEAKELAVRWGLTVALHPDDKSSWDDALFFVYLGVRAVDVLPNRVCKFQFLPEEIKVDYTPHLKDERYLTLRINLAKPKIQIMEEINAEIEKYLPLALSGKKKKVRGKAVDDLCWRIWNMYKKEGKSPWKIVQELNPGLKSLTAKGCTRKKCPEKLDFQTLTNKKKETYNNKSCGKKDSCLIAKALLKNVRDAIAKAEKQIASVSPIK
jgi:hypothetical protein